MEKIILVFAVILLNCCLVFADGPRPVVAIYANMEPDYSLNDISDKININYVRWLESAIIEVIVIHSWHSLNDIDDILSKANGVLMQGGARNLNLTNEWEKKSLYILNKVKEFNDRGNYFPLWGTCQGLELLHILVANSTEVLTKYNAYNIASPLSIINKEYHSRMFSEFSEGDLSNLQKESLTQEFHHLGVSLETYNTNKLLSEFFQITSIAKDLDDKVYVATVEAKNYPIYAIQFHPEKTPFDQLPEDKIPQILDAITVSQRFNQFFLSELKKNSNVISLQDKLKYDFIDIFKQGRGVFDDGYYVYTNPKAELKFLYE